MDGEIDFLHEMIAQLQARIDYLVNNGEADFVSWKGAAQYEQRCHRCGRWIDTGDRIATIIINNISKYVHERCVIGES